MNIMHFQLDSPDRCYIDSLLALTPLKSNATNKFWCYRSVCLPRPILQTLRSLRVIHIANNWFCLKLRDSNTQTDFQQMWSVRYHKPVNISFWTSKKHVYRRQNISERSLPPSAADFLCCCEALDIHISLQFQTGIYICYCSESEWVLHQ